MPCHLQNNNNHNFQTGDELSKRSKFVFVTWIGPNVSVMKKAKMGTDKAFVKEVIQVTAMDQYWWLLNQHCVNMLMMIMMTWYDNILMVDDDYDKKKHLTLQNISVELQPEGLNEVSPFSPFFSFWSQPCHRCSPSLDQSVEYITYICICQSKQRSTEQSAGPVFHWTFIISCNVNPQMFFNI